jgi:hypothetical protein
MFKKRYQQTQLLRFLRQNFKFNFCQSVTSAPMHIEADDYWTLYLERLAHERQHKSAGGGAAALRFFRDFLELLVVGG